MKLTTNKDKLTTYLAIQVRAERDNLLASTVDSINAVRWASMTTAKQKEWSSYRQALCNIPEQEGFPGTVEWPIQPT